MKFTTLLNYFIDEKIEKDSWEYRRHQLFISICFISALYALLFMPAAYLEDYFGAIAIQVIFIILNISYPFLIKQNVSISLMVNIWIITLGLALLCIMLISGGVYHTSTDPQLIVLMPIIALLFLNLRWAIFWLAIATIIVVTVGMLQLYGLNIPHRMNPDFVQLQNLMAVTGHAILVFMVITVFYNQKNIALDIVTEKSKLLQLEIKRSDELLHSILPKEVIEELKDTGESLARSFESVSVMFTDFVDFAQISKTFSPKELVAEISLYYKAFDEIVERNGLEKIKTMREAYLAVCGVPKIDEQHAIKTVRAALEIIEFTEKRLAAGGKFNIKIGIHSGPLITGIVGVRKFSYDIWGDTVNTALLMESSSEKGKINISNVTFELIKNDFDCMPRGEVEAKNKEMIEMFFIENV